MRTETRSGPSSSAPSFTAPNRASADSGRPTSKCWRCGRWPRSSYRKAAGRPPAYGLPPDIRVVAADAWREELYRRNVLDREARNPRARFQELRNRLAARSLIGDRDDTVWLVHPI